MYITKIQVQNYLGLEHVKVEKVGKLLRITGENGVGKSSLLAAVREAFKGSGVDPDLVMTGTEKGVITINLDDDTVIKRMLSTTTNTVDVRKGGKTVPKPATYLAALVGAINLNPVEFFNADERTQRAMLLRAMPCTLDRQVVADLFVEGGVDQSPLDDVIWTEHGLDVLASLVADIYDQRRRLGQDVTQLEKSITQDIRDLPEGVDNKRWSDYDMNAAIEELTAAQQAIRDDVRKRVERDELRIDYLQLQKDMKRLQTRMDENVLRGAALTADIEGFIDSDVPAMQGELAAYKEHLQHQATLDGVDRKRRDLSGVYSAHKQLNLLHGKLTTELPRTLLASMKVPIEGLVITEDSMTVNGRPLAKLSTSERVVFATSLARSLAGELKVICIDGYEALRGKLRAEFEKVMADDGMAYFIAEATDGPLRVDGQDPTDKAVTT